MASLFEQKLFDVRIFVDDLQAPIEPDSGSLAIRESMDYLVPTATINFKDLLSAFVSGRPFIQDTVVRISLQDDDSTKEMEFFPFQLKLKQDQKFVEGYIEKLYLISKFAEPLITDFSFESFEGKASDFVKKIAKRLGLKSDVEDTQESRVWISPNWKTPQLLRYLSTHSISVGGSSAYAYFVRFDGTLVFKTVDKMFEEGGDGEDIFVQTSGEDIGEFEGNFNLYSNVAMGGNNVDLSWYDFTKAEEVFKQVPFNKHIKKRASTAGVSTSLQDRGKNKFLGNISSDQFTFPSGFNKEIFLKSLMFSESVKLFVTVKANPFGREIGSVVNLKISSIRGEGVNMNYSGRYLIKSILTKGHYQYWQTLELIRPGVNLDQRENVV